jgi:hypothetical protein
MRWLLLFLIVLNAVVLAWFHQQQKSESRQEASSAVVSTANVPGITLLSEVPRSKIKYKKAEPKEPEPPAPVEPAPAATETAVAAPADAPAPAAEAAATPAAPASALTAAAPGIADAKPAAPPLVNKDACGFLGPFAEPITVRQVVGRLKRAQVDARIYSESTEINPVYWVYLRPAASRAAALAKLRELQAARIESFIVGEGEDANAISLGFFKKRESAESIQKQRIEQGYDAKLIKKERHRDQYWVVVQPQSRPRVDSQLLADLRAEYGEFTHRSRKCAFIASFTQFE